MKSPKVPLVMFREEACLGSAPHWRRPYSPESLRARKKGRTPERRSVIALPGIRARKIGLCCKRTRIRIRRRRRANDSILAGWISTDRGCQRERCRVRPAVAGAYVEKPCGADFAVLER